MKGLIVAFVCASLTCVAAAIIILMVVPAEADGAITYLPAPWNVGSDTTLRDGTWQVNGSITVTGCTLTLVNATLQLGYGSYSSSLSVPDTGRLDASMCTLRGLSNRYTYFNFAGTERLDNTTLERYTYLEHSAGQLDIVDCTFEAASYHIRSYSTLSVVGSTFHDASNYCIYWYPSYGSYSSLTIEGCEFIDDLGSTDNAVFINGGGYTSTAYSGVVRGCRFDGVMRAVTVEEVYSGTVLVTGNEATDCYMGIYVEVISDAITIHDNDWGIIDGGTGEYYYNDKDESRVTVWNETVAGGDYGYYFVYTDPVIELRNVSASGVACGVYFYYGEGTVEVRNSTIEASKYDFWVEELGVIRIYNTTHGHKGYVGYYSDRSVIEEVRNVEVEAVMWQSGEPLATGMTDIVNETGTLLVSIKNEYPCIVDIPSWRVDYRGACVVKSVRGAYDDRGVRFQSLMVPLVEGARLSIMIIDDRLPWAKVTSPLPGDKFKDASFKVEGLCDDLGSGLVRVRLRFGDEEWRSVPYSGTGNWSLRLVDVPDDICDIVVRVEDLAGNTNETVLSGITVDTTYPTITLVSPKAPVNRSPATLVVMTEPHARAYVDSIEVPVAENGAVVAGVELREGVNSVAVRVVDSVGREALADLSISLDTLPPALRVDSPADGAWCSSDQVVVVGLVTEEVTLTVNGESSKATAGTFSRSVRLGEELTLLLVTASDAAGNIVSETRLVHRDAMRPHLTVASPSEGAFLTTTVAVVRGTVTDASPVRVLVSGMAAEVSGGDWYCHVPLSEGSNPLEIKATDAAGNEAVMTLTLVLDTTPPRAVAMLLVEGRRVDPTLGRVDVRVSEVELEVSLMEACRVVMSVAGPASLPAGLSNMTLRLEEGLNDVRVDLYDLAGNRGDPIAFQVLVDTVKPALDLERGGQVLTRDPDFVVRGTTEPGCQVLVAGTATDLLSDSSFATVVHLKEGTNLIKVESIDPAGNRAERNLEIDLESVKVGGGDWGGTLGTLALGIAIGLLVAIVVMALRTRRRPAAPRTVQQEASTDRAVEPENEGGVVTEAGPKGPGHYPLSEVTRRNGP